MLRASRTVVALWCSLALGLFVLLAARLVGWLAAWVAGVLLASEPFLVGHSDVLHTDALVTMFSAVAVVAFAAAFRTGATRAARRAMPADGSVTRRPSWGLLTLAGLFASLAVLTKINAVALVTIGPGIVVGHELLGRRRARRQRLRGSSAAAPSGIAPMPLATVASACGWCVLVTTVCSLALWPALWVDAVNQARHVRQSLTQTGAGHPTFFRGVVSRDPGPLFYPVAMAFRLTPWLVIASLLAPVAILVRRARRTEASASALAPMVLAVLIGTPVLYAVLISAVSSKLDRYALPLLPFMALLIGIAVAQATSSLDREGRWFRWQRPAAVLVGVLLVAHTVSKAPYAISYASPMMGGQRAAERTLLLGWGEGTEKLGATILAREGALCPRVVVSYPQTFRAALPCVQLRGMGFVDGRLDAFDYVILYITLHQKHWDDPFEAAVRRSGQLLQSVTIEGVHYAELWEIPHATGSPDDRRATVAHEP